MDKFGRNYILLVETQTHDTLTIKPPFTVEFDLTRNVLTSANIASMRVYNLSQNNRNQIRKNMNDTADLRKVNLQAGYGNNLPIIFTGDISQAWSVREGTNFITQIESFDGGFAFANGIYNNQFPSNTQQKTVITDMANSLPATTLGKIGNYSGSLSRGNAYSGSPADLLQELTNGGFFIDNGKVNCLNLNECFEGDLQVIDAADGLLGTPVREQTYLNFDMIFEPRLLIGQIIELKSGTDANFNGFYKVVSIKHRGMISETVSGSAITSVGLYAPLGSAQLEVIS